MDLMPHRIIQAQPNHQWAADEEVAAEVAEEILKMYPEARTTGLPGRTLTIWRKIKVSGQNIQ